MRLRCGKCNEKLKINSQLKQDEKSNAYLYTRNFYPERPLLMPSNYKDSKLIIKRLRELHAENKLTPSAKQLLFADTRLAEELYLYREDVWQLTNLANAPKHAAALKEHRSLLDAWIKETKNQGSESLEIYQLEIDDQLRSIGNPASKEAYRKNSEVYKKWFQQGK